MAINLKLYGTWVNMTHSVTPGQGAEFVGYSLQILKKSIKTTGYKFLSKLA